MFNVSVFLCYKMGSLNENGQLVVQLNANRCRRAHDLLYSRCRRKDARVALVSEPNREIVSKSANWLFNEAQSAAIWLASGRCDEKGGGAAFVRAKVGRVSLYSVYLSPNDSREEFERDLDELDAQIRSERPSAVVIVGGDFNAKSHAWGSGIEDSRGSTLRDWAASLNLRVANVGSSPTFEQNGRTSVVDITTAGSRWGTGRFPTRKRSATTEPSSFG